MSVSPMEKALQAADEALERAQGELSSSGEAVSNQPSAVDEANGDLAAAFFAAQAKKQEAENRLPATEWAQLFPGVRLQAGQSPGGENVSCSNKSVTHQSEAMKSLIKEQLVERLHQEYKKASADK